MRQSNECLIKNTLPAQFLFKVKDDTQLHKQTMSREFNRFKTNFTRRIEWGYFHNVTNIPYIYRNMHKTT